MSTFVSPLTMDSIDVSVPIKYGQSNCARPYPRRLRDPEGPNNSYLVRRSIPRLVTDPERRWSSFPEAYIQGPKSKPVRFLRLKS